MDTNTDPRPAKNVVTVTGNDNSNDRCVRRTLQLNETDGILQFRLLPLIKAARVRES